MTISGSKHVPIALAGLILLLAAAVVIPVAAAGREPWAAADDLRAALFAAQTATLGGDAAAAAAAVTEATTIAVELDALPADSAALLGEALATAEAAAQAGDGSALAGARGLAQGALYWGSYDIVRAAAAAGDTATAQQWLLVRDYRPGTRFSRPSADATLALRQATSATVEETLSRLDADLLDTYQARLAEHVTVAADAAELPFRRAESAGLVAAYWRVLLPAYTEQKGAAGVAQLTVAADGLLPALLAGDTAAVAGATTQLRTVLEGFRAAPLAPAEQARRAGQLMRFLALVPVEYGRGVEDNTVLIDFEVQEAVTFMGGAAAAFADLRLSLAEIDPAQTAAIDEAMAQVSAALDAANRKESVMTQEELTAEVTAITSGLESFVPAE